MYLNILGLIPARGGSKTITHKNIAVVAGRPLLAYTCEAAQQSRLLTRVVLSTDDPSIAEVGKKYRVEIPFMRPAEFAKDDTPMLSVLQHALKMLQETEGYRPEVVVLLQPTSPLRRAEHIDSAVEILLETGTDSVVSVVEVPHQYSPVSLMCLEEGRLVPLQEGPLIMRRQDKLKVYARNGPAVLAVRKEVVLKKNSLYGDDCRPLIMAHEDSVDIDSPLDLKFAEFMIQRRLKNNRSQQEHSVE